MVLFSFLELNPRPRTLSCTFLAFTSASLMPVCSSTTAKNVNDNVRGRELSYEKEKNAVNYAVTKEVKQVVYAPGSVTRLSVAVAVNKILTDEEKEDIKNLVIAAAGMDVTRGDVVNVSSLKFMGIDKAEQLQTLNEEKYAKIMEMLGFIFTNVAPLLIVLVLGLVVLPTFSSIFKKPEPPKPQNQEENNQFQ